MKKNKQYYIDRCKVLEARLERMTKIAKYYREQYDWWVVGEGLADRNYVRLAKGGRYFA